MPFIGIDGAKAALEFACRPGGETGMVQNDQARSATGVALPGARSHAPRPRGHRRL